MIDIINFNIDDSITKKILLHDVLVTELKNGDFYRIGKQKKFRQYAGSLFFEIDNCSKETFLRNKDKVLIFNTDCRQRLLPKDFIIKDVIRF